MGDMLEVVNSWFCVVYAGKCFIYVVVVLQVLECQSLCCVLDCVLKLTSHLNCK